MLVSSLDSCMALDSYRLWTVWMYENLKTYHYIIEFRLPIIKANFLTNSSHVYTHTYHAVTREELTAGLIACIRFMIDGEGVIISLLFKKFQDIIRIYLVYLPMQVIVYRPRLTLANKNNCFINTYTPNG